MTSWKWWLGISAFFFATASWLLFDVQPVWWSILTVVIVFTAAVGALARAFVDRHRERGGDPARTDA